MNIRKSVKVSNAMKETTQYHLAQYLKVTLPWLGKLLKNNSPKHVEKMADFYGITTSEFIARGEQ